MQVTKDGLRPPAPETHQAAEGRAHLEDESVSDLEDVSRRVPVAELNKLGEELDASVGAAAGKGAGGDGVSAASKGGGGLHVDGGAGNSAADLGDGDDSRGAQSGGTGGVKRVQGKGGEASDVISGGASSNAASLSTAAASTSPIAAVAAAAVAAVVKDENRDGHARKATFDGYDFNTLRKVGSSALGQSGHTTPRLSAKYSSDSASKQ